ncbi:MAG: hypothetical protein SFU56_14460 [Capsulimonadales bacterium]|nr:hypothetical protein [Capsulimonadales bacterium]
MISETPAFVLDLRIVREQAETYRRIREATGVRILYATKPLLDPDALTLLAEMLDGFTASSLFSAALCREVLGTRGTLAIVTPGYRETEIPEIARLCDQVVLNSPSQWERFGPRLKSRTVGLRINPERSYLPDERYDPGRPGAKLGVPLSDLARMDPTGLRGLAGVHFHSNCDAPNYLPLEETVAHLIDGANALLRQVDWINLGGGYRLPHPDEWTPLYRTVDRLRDRYPQATVYIEPGASLVRPAGTLIASVIDRFETNGRAVAVLDTTVNHLPEVFEYRYRPEVVGHSDHHPYEVLLAGATCLAGDVFGVYRFAEPLSIGDRLTFPNVGAYTLAKAHWFNGVALPTRYAIDSEGRCRLRHHYDLEDYRTHLGWD